MADSNYLFIKCYSSTVVLLEKTSLPTVAFDQFDTATQAFLKIDTEPIDMRIEINDTTWTIQGAYPFFEDLFKTFFKTF